jgi:hypothetical protein
MSASFVHVTDALHGRCTVREVAPGTTYAALAACAQGVHVLGVNGQPLMRARWGEEVRGGQVVVLVDNLVGDPASSIAIISMFAANAFTATAIGASIASVIGVAATKFIASVVIGAVLNSLFGPKNSGPQSGPAASPTYSLGLQGNQARPGQSIPARYGYGKWFPDLAAQPYYRYIGNEQYFHALYCIGQGEHAIDGYFIDDTPFADFVDVTYELIEPGDLGTLTLLDPKTITAPEVSQQEMLTGEVIGPFVVCGPGQKVTSIGIDMAWPRGLYPSKTTEWTVSAQQIDEYGNPLAAWVVLGTESKTANTTTLQRDSYDYAVTAGRWRVRVVRDDIRTDNVSAAHDQAWIGLRGVLENGDIVNTTATFLAVKAKASKQLSGASQSRINVIGTRKLPVWDGSTWSAPQATRSIAWAYADLHRNAAYGLGWADARIDLATLLELDALYTERDDSFDFSFDYRRMALDSARSIALAGRARAFQRYGVATMARDGPKSLPSALFTMTNIAAGSLSVTYRTATSDGPDGLQASYWDSVAHDERTFDALPLPGLSASDRPTEMNLQGVTKRAHADRERHYHRAAYAYRPITIEHTVGMQGLNTSLLDLVALHHDALPRTQGGQTTAWDAATRTVTVDEPPVWTPGELHYFGFSDAQGDFHGPYECAPGVGAMDIVLAVAPSATPLTEGIDEERSRYVFGELYLAVVHAIAPAGDGKVRLTLLNHDPRVHTADEDVVDVPYSGAPVVEEPPDSGATITINDHIINGTASPDFTVGVARYIVKADGTVRYEATNYIAGAYAGEWCGTPAEAAGFDVRFDVLSGDALDEGTTGTWLRLDTDRAIAQLDGTEFGGAFTQVQVRIRNAVTLAVKDSAVITLAAAGPSTGGA